MRIALLLLIGPAVAAWVVYGIVRRRRISPQRGRIHITHRRYVFCGFHLSQFKIQSRIVYFTWLEIDQTRDVLTSSSRAPLISVTLRKIEGGKCALQITASPAFVQSRHPSL